MSVSEKISCSCKEIPSIQWLCMSRGKKSITRGMPKKTERNRLTQTKSTIVPSRVCSRAGPLQKIGPRSVTCRIKPGLNQRKSTIFHASKTHVKQKGNETKKVLKSVEILETKGINRIVCAPRQAGTQSLIIAVSGSLLG